MINFLRQSALVLILAVVFGAALAFVYANTYPQYQKNQEQAIIDSIAKTIPGAAEADKAGHLHTEQVELSDGRKVYRVSDAAQPSGQQRLGWAYDALGKGFGGDIKLLIGLNPQGSALLGIYVLEDVETPGFGHYINSEELWISKFRPKNGTPMPLDKPLIVVKTTPKAGNPYQIQAITGATISSKAVISIINDTAGKVAAQIVKRADTDGK